MSLLANNAIGWSSLQISGGWKRIGLVCATIAILIPLGMFGFAQLSEGHEVESLQMMYGLLAFTQVILLGIVVPSRVHAAIKRDRIGKLYESHRLMPVPAGHAVAGYIVGPNLMTLSAVATLFVIGAFIAVPAHQDWRGWVASHAVAGGLSATMCCLVAFSAAWLPKLNPALLGILFGPSMLSVAVLPPLRVLFGPYINSFRDLQRGVVTPEMIISIAAQVLFSAIFFIGACRRYRRDDVPALGFLWGYALLCLWIAITLIGVLATTSPIRAFGANDPVAIAYIISLTLSLLLAIGPIGSAAGAMLRWRERKAIDRHFIDPRPTGLIAATVLVGIALLALLLAVPKETGALTTLSGSQPTEPIHLVLTGVAIAIYVLTIAGLAQAAARLRFPALGLIAVWLVVTWVGPPLVDGIVTVLRGNYQSYPHMISGVSTPFCLGLIWADQTGAAEIGLVAQAGLILLLAIGWAILKRSNSRRHRAAFAAT